MQMSDNLIESLLHQDEGPTLDFKGHQYQFKKSDAPKKTENLRSHLVKDLLAFANTHRDSSAFILIGVEEVKGSRSNVIGVKEHLIDDDLHDFMNKLTNRPVQFSYIQHNFEGVQLGVIVIPVQANLFYLIKPYGELQVNAVYVKDGSSTRIATPDEVVEMSTTKPPSLVVDWVDPSKNEAISSTCMLCPLVLSPPLGTDAIQRSPLPRSALGIPMHSYNEDYPEELISYSLISNAFSSLSLQIHNHGEVTGENVCFEGLIAKSDGLYVTETLPDFPTEIYEFLPPIQSRTYETPTTRIYLSEGTDLWLIEVEFGNVRPGERIVADDQLWFSSTNKMSATMTGRILGENIPEPIQCSRKIRFETLQRPMTIEDINRAKLENVHNQ